MESRDREEDKRGGRKKWWGLCGNESGRKMPCAWTGWSVSKGGVTKERRGKSGVGGGRAEGRWEILRVGEKKARGGGSGGKSLRQRD